MYMRDAKHSSYASVETELTPATAAQLQTLWSVNVGAPISSGVTIANGKLYVGDWEGNFHAIDAATGEVLWSQFLGKAPDPVEPYCWQPGIGINSQAAVADGTVYVGGGDSAVYAIDADSGTIRWRTALADPVAGGFLWSSVTLVGNALYVGIASLGNCPSVRGGLARIDLAQPDAPLVRYTMPPDRVGGSIWTTPAVDEEANIVYVTTGNGDPDQQDAANGVYGSTLLAMDATTLEILAYFFLPLAPTDLDADFSSSPNLFTGPDGQPYVAAIGKTGWMYVLRRPGLSLAWSYKVATNCIAPQLGCGSVSSPAFDGETLYAGAGHSDAFNSPPSLVYAFDPATHEPRWTYGAPGVVIAPVTVTPNLVFVPTAVGLRVVSRASGREIWADDRTAPMYGQTVVDGGVVYSTDADGYVVARVIPPGAETDPGPAVTPASLTFRYTIGGDLPEAQVLSFTGVTLDDMAADRAWLSVAPADDSTTGAITVGVSVAGLNPGQYTGSINLGGGISVPVSLTVNGAMPSLAVDSIRNSASLHPGPLAPGTLFTISAPFAFGSAYAAAAIPWSTHALGVSVTIDGIRAPIGSITKNRISGQIPFEVRAGEVALVVNSNGAVSAPVSVTIALTAPAIPANGQDLGGQEAIAPVRGADGRPNATENPAAPGSTISVIFTGQGQLDSEVGTGNAAPFRIPANTLASTAAAFGGVPSPVVFSGLRAGYVGLAQADIEVPVLPPGPYYVVLNVGGASSNATKVWVGAPADAQGRTSASKIPKAPAPLPRRGAGR